MSWNTPREVERTIAAFTERWPEVKRYHLHLHDARGSALVSAYQAFRLLDETHTLLLGGPLADVLGLGVAHGLAAALAGVPERPWAPAG